jgi:hypothetical protein
MARSNYSYEKRRKELEKKAKVAEDTEATPATSQDEKTITAVEDTV